MISSTPYRTVQPEDLKLNPAPTELSSVLAAIPDIQSPASPTPQNHTGLSEVQTPPLSPQNDMGRVCSPLDGWMLSCGISLSVPLTVCHQSMVALGGTHEIPHGSSHVQ